MAKDFGAGFHVAPGQEVDSAAYDQWTGRWSRLFVPATLSAANVTPGARVLDVSTGTGEAALLALPIAGPSGFVVGADISPAMLRAARQRLGDAAFLAIGADGQALPFADGPAAGTRLLVQAQLLVTEGRRQPVVAQPAALPALEVDAAHGHVLEVRPLDQVDEVRLLAGIAEDAEAKAAQPQHAEGLARHLRPTRSALGGDDARRGWRPAG